MDLKEFVKSEINQTNQTVFSSGWVKSETVTKVSGTKKIKTTKQLFNAKQEGMPDGLAGWLASGEITLEQ